MTEVETKCLEYMHKIELTVTRIEAACKPCAKRVDDHEVILRGHPGNGTRPGLEQQVAVMTASHSAMQKAHVRQMKWFRGQLGAVIMAFLAAMGLIVNNWINGGGATP